MSKDSIVSTSVDMVSGLIVSELGVFRSWLSIQLEVFQVTKKTRTRSLKGLHTVGSLDIELADWKRKPQECTGGDLRVFVRNGIKAKGAWWFANMFGVWYG